MKANGIGGILAIMASCAWTLAAEAQSQEHRAGVVQITSDEERESTGETSVYVPYAEPASWFDFDYAPTWRDYFPPTGRNGYFMGAGAVIVEPEFDSSTAFTTDDQSGAVNITRTEDFSYDYDTAPRVWVGWQDDYGLAGRVTYFEFKDSRKASATAARDFVFFNSLPTPTVSNGIQIGGTAGDFIQTRSDFEYYTLDAEITQELNFNSWQTTFGGGFRHSSVLQKYSAVGTAGGLFSTSNIAHRFDGEGPTVFADVRIPVMGKGDRRFIGSTNVSLFGHARGAVSFGNVKLNAVDTDPGQTNIALLRERESLTTGEFRIGAHIDIRPVDGGLMYITVAWEAITLSGIGSLNSLADDNDAVLTGGSVLAGFDW